MMEIINQAIVDGRTFIHNVWVELDSERMCAKDATLILGIAKTGIATRVYRTECTHQEVEDYFRKNIHMEMLII